MLAFTGMRTLVIGLFLNAALGSAFAEGRTPEEFLVAVRAAVEAKSPEQLMALTYTEGMSEKDKETVLRTNAKVFADAAVETVGYEEIPEGQEFVHITRGRKIEPTAEPAGMVKVAYVRGKESKPGFSPDSLSLPYVLINGEHRLMGVKVTDLGWTGPEDKSFSVILLGKGAGEAKTLVRWNASGVDLEKTFTRTSINLSGQFIKEVMVTSDREDGDVLMQIRKGVEKIYESERLQGKGSLIFKGE